MSQDKAETDEPGFPLRHFKTQRPGRRLVSVGAVASAVVKQLSTDQSAVGPQTPILPLPFHLEFEISSNNKVQ